jgi:hypothetical protein
MSEAITENLKLNVTLVAKKAWNRTATPLLYRSDESPSMIYAVSQAGSGNETRALARDGTVAEDGHCVRQPICSLPYAACRRRV